MPEFAFRFVCLDELATGELQKNDVICRCLPSCYSIQYDAEILKAEFNVENYFKQLENIFDVSIERPDEWVFHINDLFLLQKVFIYIALKLKYNIKHNYNKEKKY